jgi:toxin ParE1/3/4
MKVRYAEPAADDLDDALTYYRDHAPSFVVEFSDSIDDAIARIAENPYAAQETEQPGIRRWYLRRFKYSIFYTISGEEVVIVYIRHAARRWPWEEVDDVDE